MSNERRQQRVARAIRDIVSESISDLQDPRLTGFVSVTSVEMSPDLRRADVFVSCFGVPEAEQNLTFKAIEHARGHFQTEIAKDLNMMFCPIITFRHDVNQSKVNETLKIIDQLTENRIEEESDQQTNC